MKHPVSTAIITEARMYAVESINHTMDYSGWDDGHEKTMRITIGKFSQLWLCEVCHLNMIPYEKDTSSPYMPDQRDLTINGWAVDCKATVSDGLEGQVGPGHDKKNNSIDLYAFFRTGRNMEFIEPLGFVWARDLLTVAKKISQGERIPGTNIDQRFRYSYFVPLSNMDGFFKTLNSLKGKPKNDDSLCPAFNDELPF